MSRLMTVGNSKWKITKSASGLRAKMRPLFWSPRAMVVAALALRLLVMGFAYPLRLDPSLDHDAFGGEVGRVARSIVTGHGFSSPFPGPTGPTAFIPPVYAYFVAGVFKLFGIYTRASALVILTLNNLVSGKSGVSPEMAVRLSKAFGSSPETWLGMQADYDLAEVMRHEADIKVERVARAA